MISPSTITANTSLELKDTGVATVGRWIVSVVKTGGTFTIKPQKRLHPTGGVTGHAYADCWYVNALTNAGVAAGVTQTVDFVFDIDSSGCDTQLVITVAGGASISVHATPMAG